MTDGIQAPGLTGPVARKANLTRNGAPGWVRSLDHVSCSRSLFWRRSFWRFSLPTQDYSPLASPCPGNRGRLDARQYTTALERYFPTTLPVPAAKGTNYGGRADIAE